MTTDDHRDGIGDPSLRAILTTSVSGLALSACPKIRITYYDRQTRKSLKTCAIGELEHLGSMILNA